MATKVTAENFTAAMRAALRAAAAIAEQGEGQ